MGNMLNSIRLYMVTSGLVWAWHHFKYSVQWCSHQSFFVAVSLSVLVSSSPFLAPGQVFLILKFVWGLSKAFCYLHFACYNIRVALYRFCSL